MTQRRHEEIGYTQNFLRDPHLVERLVKMANIRCGDTILEIGPGKGIITRKLAEAVATEGQVIAVELDPKLAKSLEIQFSQMPQIKILNRDILRFDLSELAGDYVAFANIPFNITSELLELLLNASNGPRQAHLILQTDALMAENTRGDAGETFKSLLIKPLYKIDLVYRFSRSDFVPQPGVETGLFAFSRRSEPLIDPTQYNLYKDFLAFVSKDRVGEGIWLRIFSRPQLQKLADQAGLILGRGLKSQSAEAITSAFQMFTASSRAKLELVKGAIAALREEQQRREEINRAGGHRRPRQ